MNEESANLASLLPRRTIAVAGLGLLGGSLGLALRRAAPGLRVIGYARRPASIEEAMQLGAIQDGDTEADCLAEADCTVVCMPISATLDFIANNASVWHRDSIVTDVCSTKATVVPTCSRTLKASGVHFVGSHPMAGKEHSGLSHSEASLYHNAHVFLCSDPATPEGACKAVELLWRTVGACPVPVDANRHDALVARTSHLPHVAAAVLARQLPDDPLAVHATGGAFRDMTRVAASSPSMWADICRHNQHEVAHAIEQMQSLLSHLQALIREQRWEELEAELQKGRDRRLHWQQHSGTNGDATVA